MAPEPRFPLMWTILGPVQHGDRRINKSRGRFAQHHSAGLVLPTPSAVPIPHERRSWCNPRVRSRSRRLITCPEFSPIRSCNKTPSSPLRPPRSGVGSPVGRPAPRDMRETHGPPGPVGAPKTAMIPSPVNWFTVPPYRLHHHRRTLDQLAS